MEKPSPKQAGRIVPRLLFVVPLLLVCAVAALSVWGILHAQAAENKTSLQAVEGYFESLSVGDFERINRDSGFAPSLLCGWRAYDEHLSFVYGGDFSSLRLSGPEDTDEGSFLYTVSRGDTPLAQVCAAPLENGDGWRVFTLIAEDYTPYTITAPSHLRVAADGVVLSADHVIQTQTVAGYEGLPPDSDAPHVLAYETPPMLSPPRVTAETPDGARGEASWDEAGRQAVVSLHLTDEAHEAAARETFEVYAAYTAGETDFEALEPFLLPGTDFFDSLAQTDFESTGLTAEILNVRDMTEWSQSAFSAVAAYRLVGEDDEDDASSDSSEPITVILYLVRLDEGWLLANIAEVV